MSKENKIEPLNNPVVIRNSIIQKAISWWDDLELEEKEKIEREFGYYGHDIGINEDDIIYFYTQTFKI